MGNTLCIKNLNYNKKHNKINTKIENLNNNNKDNITDNKINSKVKNSKVKNSKVKTICERRGLPLLNIKIINNNLNRTISSYSFNDFFDIMIENKME